MGAITMGAIKMGPIIMGVIKMGAIWLALFVLTGCQTATATTTSFPPATETPALLTEATSPPIAPTTTPTAIPIPAPATILPTATPFTPPDLRYLAAELDEALSDFTGLSSYTVIDLQTGQQIAREPALAVAGASMLKIPIILEAYRALDGPPDVAQMRLITETATLSGNFTANLLLEIIAGKPDPYAGAQSVTTALRQIGLYDTFIAVPYDLEPIPSYQTTYFTPANQRQDLTTNPDPHRQTTTGDLAILLQAIYDCTHGRGLLLATFPESLTADKCAQTLRQFEANRIDAFIESGTPPEATLAHKHGWVDDTHGDAALVLSPGGDYVLVIALYQAGWLEWDISNPLIGELARLSYAHFNDPAAYPVELLATPLPPLITPTATPDFLQGRIANTHGAGLTLRETPGGAEITVLPEGMLLYLLPEQPQNAAGVSWQKIMTALGEIGWVGSDYLATGENAGIPR